MVAPVCVLVVDDNPDVREIVTRVLRNAGYAVREASSVAGALEILATQPVAVALCDYHLPGPDGLSLVQQIGESFPGVAAVLMTGDTSALPHASTPGVAACLAKPFSPKAAVAIIQEVLARRP